MALKRVVDSIEDVPENLRELYVETPTGKYRLDAEDDDSAELKRAIEKERKNSETLKLALEKFRKEHGDIDPEEFRALKADAEKREQERAAKAGEWDKVKAQIEEKYGKEIAQRDQALQETEAAYRRTLLEGAALSAIAAEKGIPAMLMPKVLKHLRDKKSDGKFDVVVVDEQGNERISPRSGSDGPMTVAELVTELKADAVWARAFDGSSSSGGGATQNGSNGVASGVRTKADLKSREAKSAFIDKHGLAAFDALPLQ